MANLEAALRQRRICYRDRKRRGALISRLHGGKGPLPTEKDLDDLLSLALLPEDDPHFAIGDDSAATVERWLSTGEWRGRLDTARKTDRDRETRERLRKMDDDEATGRIVCRVMGDRAPLRIVAAEFDVSIEEIEEIVRVVALRYGHGPGHIEATLKWGRRQS